MRKDHPAIIDGTFHLYLEDHPSMIVYTRVCARETLLVIANMSGAEQLLALPQELSSHIWKQELSNLDTDSTIERIWQPWEAAVYSLDF